MNLYCITIITYVYRTELLGYCLRNKYYYYLIIYREKIYNNNLFYTSDTEHRS